MTNMSTKELVLGYFIENNRILLGKKKRGFGLDKWNGFGGKCKSNETYEAALVRECKEECGLTPGVALLLGEIYFTYRDLGSTHHVLVYRIDTYTGTLGESEEMHPEWFELDTLPYKNMWPSDALWLRFLLQNISFEGRCELSSVTGEIYTHTFTKKI